jgi:hypothetical protein
MADELDQIKKILGGDQSNIRQEYNNATVGLNMDQSVNQIRPGTLTYALNAAVENFDANSVNYQNEPGNELCISFPNGYSLIGSYLIQEKNKNIFFICNPSEGKSQIGYMDNNDCIYHTLVDSDCLNFNINHPIHKVVHRITNCTTEIYWTDGYNPRRYLDIENIPWKLMTDSSLCDPIYDVGNLDCNQLKIQPNFSIPTLDIINVVSGGDLTSGVYQFAIQYSDAVGNPYTSYYSVTNPTPIANTQLTTPDFSYSVGKSIIIDINALDISGQFNYYNLAVIKTINAITSVELVGTFSIENPYDTITYTGQNVVSVTVSINDIFEKYPYYDIAEDLTAVQDVLVWDQLISVDRINYQSIASKINLLWETYRIPSTENYSDELNATNLRGYLRDEVYAFEIVFLLKNGKQTDGFHIPGREKNYNEYLPDVPTTNADFIGEPDYVDPVTNIGYSPYWKIYNTGSVIGPSIGPNIGNATPYQYGEFAYWESIEDYPCNEALWGDLAGQPIRHHKFPDVLVSPIYENPNYVLSPGFKPVVQNDAVYPIGVKIDVPRVLALIQTSNLTQEQKDDIVGFKIVRGDRSTNRSIVAKGMLRNVGEYTREEQTLYYPNYPYNDLNDDPFLLSSSNSYTVLGQAEAWMVECRVSGKYEYTSVETAKQVIEDMVAGEVYEFCSLTRPIFLSGLAYIGPANYDVVLIPTGVIVSCYRPEALIRWTLNNAPAVLIQYAETGSFCQYNIDIWVRRIDVGVLPINPDTGGPAPGAIRSTRQLCDLKQFPTDRNIGRISKLTCNATDPLPITKNENNKYRQIFNSPETSFGQPFLGDILKLEQVMIGGGHAHFVGVKNNAKYRLLSYEAQQDALEASFLVGGSDITAVFTAYQAYLQIYINGITRKNYAYSFNSVASYDYYSTIGNNVTSNGITGIKQRKLDLESYLIPGVQNVGDKQNINNFQRESSVYLRTIGSENNSTPSLPYPNQTASLLDSSNNPIIEEVSRFTIGSSGVCDVPEKEQHINVISYYASLKNIFLNQWGQIYSYNTIDTGYQAFFNSQATNLSVIFGGDTFISRFAFKTKLPFFIDNRVDGIDDSDIFYDEIGNVAYPKYWHSARSILYSYGSMTNIISIKAHSFDCYTDPATIPKTPGGPSGTYRTFYDGDFYLFAYGIPNFYCETSYNVDLRQAFNNREGDFWPHVSTGIPDDWVQQTYVPIIQDNTYYYNITYSKQNKETAFTHLPNDWKDICFTNYPFRTIYSDTANDDADNRVNNWLTYRPLSYFDFPQNYGNLTSLDGIQNRAILARFENKTLMYNNLLTIDTSNPQAAYVGNPNMFSAPPIDFAETDLGYVGSQNKMLLKIPQGQITVDAKRGQIFLISGTQAVDLTAFGSGVNRFMTDHLAFEILRYFPKVDTDNHFNGIGLHGVYDSKFDRVIITKLDYIPVDKDVKYDEITKEFYVEDIINDTVFRTQVYLSDRDYFCNKSWTLSFNFNTKSWVSFHSYIPNFYIAENNFFYSGLNGCCDSVDGEATFEALVGIMDRVIPTTTSTTTSAPFYTTTTTTTAVLNCNIQGIVVETNCELEGEAEITVYPSTTTTTTTCFKPYYTLYDVELLIGYQYDGFPYVDSTQSEIDACAASVAYLDYYSNSPSDLTVSILNATLSTFNTQGFAELGDIIYTTNDLNDCQKIQDGWFFIVQGGFENYLYNVVNGVIVEIVNCYPPTTTTTTSVSPTTTTTTTI